MATVDDLEVTRVVEDGAGVLVELCGLGKGDEDVERGEGVGGVLKGNKMVGDSGAEFDEFVVFE